jgi:hypothetical protein
LRFPGLVGRGLGLGSGRPALERQALGLVGGLEQRHRGQLQPTQEVPLAQQVRVEHLHHEAAARPIEGRHPNAAAGPRPGKGRRLGWPRGGVGPNGEAVAAVERVEG